MVDRTFDFTATGQPSFWSWIAMEGGHTDFQIAMQFATTTRVSAVFLAAVLAVEIIIVAYCHRGLNVLAEQTLNSLN